MMVSTNKCKIMHATSVYINGKGIVIFGKSGSGKSKLAIKLIAFGAKLISDDQTQLELKKSRIILRKPVSTPNFIEARGIGLIEVPKVTSAELFCFIKITDIELERLPYEKQKNCFGKKIKMIEFNPKYNNESALFFGLRYGINHNTV